MEQKSLVQDFIKTLTSKEVFEQAVELQKLLFATKNPHRNQILNYLYKQKKPILMRKLYEKLGGSKFLSYKSYYLNMKVLEECNLIKLEKNRRASGQAVTVIPSFEVSRFSPSG